MTKSGMELRGELTSTGTSFRKHLKKEIWSEKKVQILYRQVVIKISFRKCCKKRPVCMKQGITAAVQIFRFRSAVAFWRPGGYGEKGEGEQEQGGRD